ncbi:MULTISPECIES: transketolase family protein [unclassified Streptomyces]|uniref:transketolase family protein n=1 Tax=unclassified Streptomyces TaxID=2593676 RepID=UPI0022592B6C|nr:MULTISPECIES: transketolase C-terminal domain-containing protein [unclassified Streptomyces]MCX5144107.1 transketolase [Streptomyces sp. NBC_00338]WRZ68484.1 transketolase [Streptomyces sp. NBC_01257]WSU62442.1 transketolase [Streptomyces sp. NBC_01104]
MPEITPERVSTRAVFADALPELAVRHNVLVVDTDTGSIKPTPEMDYLNVGIAENAAIGLAAGAEHCGRRALVCTFAAFSVSRAFEFIKLDIAYPRRRVCIVGTHGGASGGWLGPTHHATEDLALMNALPHMRVVVPADARQAVALLEQCLEYDGPAYLRLGRKASPVFADLPAPELGIPQEVRPGSDIALVATGPEILATALEVAQGLAGAGYSAQVINVHTVDPESAGAAGRAVSEQCRWLVTLEEAWTSGGMGAQVAAAAGARGIPWLPVGVTGFLPPGSHTSLLEASGLTTESVLRQVLSFVTHPK